MEYFDTSCYLFETSEDIHEDAEAYCGSLHLVYINSNKEQAYLAERCRYISADIDYWIGLTRNNGAFIWMDATALLYTNWESSSSDDGSACIKLRENRDYEWDDQDCDDQNAYICETEIDSGILKSFNIQMSHTR